MTEAARRLLESFEALPEEEQGEVAAAILRRVAQSEHSAPEDEELVGAAESVFLELERHESQE
jgi:hypothetical protein